MWISALILSIAFGFSYYFKLKYAWVIGLLNAVVLQILIFIFWEEAKFGTIPNILLLTVSIVLFGYYNFQNLVHRETIQLINKNIKTEKRTINESDIICLPEPVKKWLKQSGAIGRPYINYGKVTQIAKMQMKPEQDNWLTANATQYTTIDNPAFIWYVDVKMNSILSFQGRDKYDEGKGEMLIKLNSLFNLVNERGEKLNEGTLQRYLGEMVWLPSLALSPYIKWEEIDDSSAKATMSYKGTSGSGTFYFNSNGEIIKFSCLRYKGNEADAKRYNWEINISGYKSFEEIRVPAIMTSTWRLENKDWTWLKLEVMDIKYNNNVIL